MLIDSQPGRGTRIEIEVPGARTPLGGGFLMAPFRISTLAALGEFAAG